MPDTLAMQTQARFGNSKSISSSDYFGREDDFDDNLSAGELLSRVSYQAKQDMQSVKQAASSAGRMLKQFFNEMN